MAFNKEENNIFFIAIVITVTVFPFIATQNVDCKGKAFHCVNSTHFKICVDLGGGISTTVDDFVIPCPRSTVCKSSNYFECEYIATTTLKPTQKSEVSNDISVTPSLKDIDIATTFYNKTSENKLSEIVVSTISPSTLEFRELTTESALQNITSDVSDSDMYRLRETTIGETSMAKELTSTIFGKVTLDNIEFNDKVKINITIKNINTTGTEIGNALSNSNLSKVFNENYKISDIESSTSIFNDFSSNFKAKNDKDYENQNIEQLPVTVVKNTIFDGLTSTSSIDYTTEISQSSYNTKYFVSGQIPSIESEITSVSYNKTSNPNISYNNINNLTEIETISLASDEPYNLIDVTNKTNNLKYKEISIQKVNNTKLAEIGEIIIDPAIEPHVVSIWDNKSTSEVYEKNKENNGFPKVLSELSKAVKYTATDKNIFYNPVTTEAENLLITEKIDATINYSPNDKNSNSTTRYNKTAEAPNLNYTTVDLLQNTKKSTLNNVKVLKNMLSPGEQILTTEASNLLSKIFLTPQQNLASQFEHEDTTKDSLLLEQFSNTISTNNFANTEFVPDMSYAMEPSPKLEEISSQFYLLNQTSLSSNHNNSMGVINTESITSKVIDIYTSMKDQNTYPTPTLYKDEPSIERTTVENELPSEVLTTIKATTINNYYEKVTIVPNNTFISTEKIAKTVGSNIYYNVFEKKLEKLSTTQAAFPSLNSNESVQYKYIELNGTSTLDPVKFNDNTLVSLYEFENTTGQDIESKNNITNDEILIHTVNYNNISKTNYINDSDAITVERTNLRKKISNKNKNIINTLENFKVTDVFNTSLFEPRVNFTENTNVNVQILDTTTKMPIENVGENRTDIKSAVGKLKLSDIYITRDSGLELEQNNDAPKLTEGKKEININQSITNITSNTVVTTQTYNNIAAQGIMSENSKIKVSDTVIKVSNLNIFREGAENLENGKQLIITNTEIGDINGYDATEINMDTYNIRGTNDTIENSVSNPTSSGINITKANNTQILTYFNNTEHMNEHSIDNNENIQKFNNLKITAIKYTTPFIDTTFIDTTVPISNVTSYTEITTQMYNSIEYNSSQQMTNNTTVNDSDIIEIITLKKNEIIDLNVTAEIVLPIENISKNSSENVETNKTTIINVIGNLSLDENSVTNKQHFNNITFLENSTTHNKKTTADINIVQNILKETNNISLLEKNNHTFYNTKATVIDIPSYYTYNVSKEKILNNNTDVKRHFNVSVSDHFNKKISNNSSFRDVDINVQNNIYGDIKEMKLTEIEDTLKRDKSFNEENNNTIQTYGYAEPKEIEIMEGKNVVNDRSVITNGVINKYNRTLMNESKLTTNNTLLNNTSNIANLLANYTTSMSEQHENNDSNNNEEKNIFSTTEIKNNATKSSKTFLNQFDNKHFNNNSVNGTKITETKVRITLPQLNITNISYEDTRNEPMNIENNKTNQKIPYSTEIQNISVIKTQKLNIYSLNDTDISLKTNKDDVKEANKQTNFKNNSADHMLHLVNGEVRPDNFSAAINVVAATFIENTTSAPSSSSQAAQKSNQKTINETNVNESFNKSGHLHIFSRNKNVTVNLGNSSKSSKSITPKNILDIVLTATQPTNINFTTDYIAMATSSLKYDSVSQQDLSVTRQSFSTASTNIVKDDLLYTEITSDLIKDDADIPQIPKTVLCDFTRSPYEEKNKVTHSIKDIINIEENKDVNGNLYTKEHQTKVANTVPTFLTVTTHNIRQIPPTQPADILKPITCKMRSHGKYPDENDCNKFYICMGNQSPIIEKCPIGTVFSDIRKQCTNNLSHCIRNNQFKCLAEGRFVDVMSNDYYYICARNKRGFVRFKLKCQEGYYLNRNTIHCLLKHTFEEDSRNTSESRTKESVSSETFRYTKHFICVNEGKFEFPDDCRKYYVCKKKSSVFRRRLKQCDSDEVFDRDRKECVDDESYECRF